VLSSWFYIHVQLSIVINRIFPFFFFLG
jgi:hypothetical protein